MRRDVDEDTMLENDDDVDGEDGKGERRGRSRKAKDGEKVGYSKKVESLRK